MQEQSKALITLKRLAAAWPVLALPFVPVVGKTIGSFIFCAVVAHTALQ